MKSEGVGVRSEKNKLFLSTLPRARRSRFLRALGLIKNAVNSLDANYFGGGTFFQISTKMSGVKDTFV